MPVKVCGSRISPNIVRIAVMGDCEDHIYSYLSLCCLLRKITNQGNANKNSRNDKAKTLFAIFFSRFVPYKGNRLGL